MDNVITLVKCSGIEDVRPFLVPVASIQAVQVPDTDPPGPAGVFLVELSDRPGRYWTWNLDPRDLAPGIPITVERQPR